MLAGNLSWPRLLEIAGHVYKDVPHVNRCLWWLGHENVPDVRPLGATITRPRLDLLRKADALVMDALRRHGIYNDIWQCPTVLVPASCNGSGRELIIVRPIRSERGMTATPAPLPDALIREIRPLLLELDGVSGLALDVTTKPPGTIEWE
jgi:GMP synthase (glutamine-hydrolysing)